MRLPDKKTVYGEVPDHFRNFVATNLERGEEQPMKKKLSVGLVFAIVLMLAAVTALAAVLGGYFDGFSKLEDTYGDYEQWPESAKVELAKLMWENGVLNPDNAPQWKDELSGEEREKAADEILASYFSGMLYMDTYNVMMRELGPIESWTEENRALYTSLMQQYGRQKSDWPVFRVPTGKDLTREEAVSRAREATLAMYSVTEEVLDGMVVDAIFQADAYNDYGVPADEPYWMVQFGYGSAYRNYMTRHGEMLAISAPGTQEIPWGFDIVGAATAAEPGSYDATREQAVLNARNALTEVINLPMGEAEAMDAITKFFYSDFYCDGKEPVWYVTFSQKGVPLYNVLLGYDASFIDIAPAGKEFGNVFRADSSLSDLVRSLITEEDGFDDYYINSNGVWFYDWSLEEKAAFDDRWTAVVDAYVAKNPYFQPGAHMIWYWTRNAFGLPDGNNISQERAMQIACDEVMRQTGKTAKLDSPVGFKYFFVTTDPNNPQWRIFVPTEDYGWEGTYFVTINAIDGSVLGLYSAVEMNPDHPHFAQDEYLAKQ